jgi:hypothetical protein
MVTEEKGEFFLVEFQIPVPTEGLNILEAATLTEVRDGRRTQSWKDKWYDGT